MGGGELPQIFGLYPRNAKKEEDDGEGGEGGKVAGMEKHLKILSIFMNGNDALLEWLRDGARGFWRGERYLGVRGEGISKLTQIYSKLHKWGFLLAQQGAGQVPGRCRAGAGQVPGRCRAGAGQVPGRCRAGAGQVPGRCRAGCKMKVPTAPPFAFSESVRPVVGHFATMDKFLEGRGQG